MKIFGRLDVIAPNNNLCYYVITCGYRISLLVISFNAMND